ncbi:MAG: SH3 domain-containing protein [Maritimibacter sp.]|nr:SH3 domain-containing protein [Maritimibacter sp.]
MIRLLAFALLLLPGLARAQDIFPALYDVTAVAADDVLNVRADPMASAEKLGEFAPDATGIEVVELSDGGDWGRVNLSETTGWVSMAFLARQPGQGYDDWLSGLAPRGLDCFGTEPFWSLALGADGTLVLTDPFVDDGSPRPGAYVPVPRSAGAAPRGFQGWMADDATGLTGILSFEICSDGMSDALYGLALDLVHQSPARLRLDGGCCRLVP